jgi:hypothetical protein
MLLPMKTILVPFKPVVELALVLLPGLLLVALGFVWWARRQGRSNRGDRGSD